MLGNDDFFSRFSVFLILRSQAYGTLVKTPYYTTDVLYKENKAKLAMHIMTERQDSFRTIIDATKSIDTLYIWSINLMLTLL